MTKRLSAVTGEYTDKQTNQTKAEWTNIGVILQSQSGKEYMLLDPAVSLSGVLAKQNALAIKKGEQVRDNVMVSLIEENQQGQQQGGYGQQQQSQQYNQQQQQSQQYNQQQRQNQQYNQQQGQNQQYNQQQGQQQGNYNQGQQQGGFAPQQNKNQPQSGCSSNPMEPPIDFDDDIPF